MDKMNKTLRVPQRHFRWAFLRDLCEREESQKFTPKIADNHDMDTLWNLFKEYHDYILQFANEQKLPSEKKFKCFWPPSNKKLALIFYSKDTPIGFCLFQVVKTKKEESGYLEVGAIYLKKKHRRGFNGVKIYNLAITIGKQLNMPLRSEIAQDNDLSIKLIRTLAKRYSHYCKNANLQESRLKNGRFLFIYSQTI